jgi:membrane carboxypeptidase/penicillin-binding protein PbpC
VIPLDAVRTLELEGGLDNRCRVLGEPPLADAGRLLREAPVLASARDAAGHPRRVVLGPASPSWRTLQQLPLVVVQTFLEAEDGRFYQHAGLDLGQLRRALAHDLATASPGRGGSTITQQVAKNLFLSGDRSLGR